MRHAIVLSLATLLLASCKLESSSAENVDATDAMETPDNLASTAGLVFCPEINRRTTQEDCSDLTATAAQAQQGTAAFNVPTMARGKATMIQLAISLTPPPAPTPEPTTEPTPESSPDDSAGPSNAADSLQADPAEKRSAQTPSSTAAPATASNPADVVKDLPGRTEEYAPLVGRDMRAELIGDGFKIEPKNSVSQVLSPGSTTSWEWEVTPLRATNYALTIKTAVEGVMANGEHVVLGSTVQTRKVDVSVAWYDRLHDGLVDAPDWIKLLGGVLLALAGLMAAWWRFFRAAKGKDQTDKDADAGAKATPSDGPDSRDE